MRRALILASDLIISTLIVAWFEWGRWLDLFGFNGHHPESALDYLQGLVCTGTALFASVFALLSIILVFAGPADGPGKSRLFFRSFYGNGRALLGKYSAFILSVVVSPAFYSFMWQANVSRSIRISGGFLMESIMFFLVLVLAERFVLAGAIIPRTETSGPSGAKRVLA